MNRLLLTTLVLCAGLCSSVRAEEHRSALYLLAGADGKILTNNDANNYFNLPSGQLGPQGELSGVLHLGVQAFRFLALEGSVNLGPFRDNVVTYQNPPFGTTRSISTRWALTTYSLTPALTWTGLGFVNFLGVRGGLANLKGHVDDDAFGQVGSYEQDAQVYDLGVLFRSSQFIAGNLSLGLELGYDWTMFKDIRNSNGSGSYDPVHSPERNVSGIGHGGPQTELDFSGAHVALVLGLWSNSPVASDLDADDGTSQSNP